MCQCLDVLQLGLACLLVKKRLLAEVRLLRLGLDFKLRKPLILLLFLAVELLLYVRVVAEVVSPDSRLLLVPLAVLTRELLVVVLV